MDLQAQFESAVAASKTLSEKPDNDILLQLYSLYKQATEGDVSGEAPVGLDFVAKAKYDAWTTVKGKPKEKAMEEYIALVQGLGGL